jgi:hypothetical protein
MDEPQSPVASLDDMQSTIQIQGLMGWYFHLIALIMRERDQLVSLLQCFFLVWIANLKKKKNTMHT